MLIPMYRCYRRTLLPKKPKPSLPRCSKVIQILSVSFGSLSSRQWRESCHTTTKINLCDGFINVFTLKLPLASCTPCLAQFDDIAVVPHVLTHPGDAMR